MINKEPQYISSVGELNKHVGEILVCYYYWGNKIDKPWFMWMGKFQGLVKSCNFGTHDRDSIRGKRLLMDNEMTIGDCYGFKQKAPYELLGNSCDAQSFIRTPTKEELKTYMNFFRHIRIFGR